jgi:hypothetical protein
MNKVILTDIHSIIHDYGLDESWELFREKTILVTGATSGFLAYFVYVLLELNRERNLNCTVVCMVRNAEKAKAIYVDYLDDFHLKLYIQDIVEPINGEWWERWGGGGVK